MTPFDVTLPAVCEPALRPTVYLTTEPRRYGQSIAGLRNLALGIEALSRCSLEDEPGRTRWLGLWITAAFVALIALSLGAAAV